MGLITNVYQLSTYAFWMREGDAFTLPSAGTAGKTSKPDGDDPAYISLGLIESFEHDYSGGQDLEVWRPSPGHLELDDIREIKPKLMCKFTAGELTPIALETFYRASQLMDGTTTQFTPGGGTLHKGWIHLELYDAHADTPLFTFDMWGRLKITGGMKSEETSIVKPTYEFVKLYSTLNTAGIET